MSAPYVDIELQPAPFGAPPPPRRELARMPSPTPSESRALDAAARKRPRPRDLLTRGTVGASPSTRAAPVADATFRGMLVVLAIVVAIIVLIALYKRPIAHHLGPVSYWLRRCVHAGGRGPARG
jgi:hypothetical protein